MIAQVPSDRRVMVVPSGRVTLAVAKLSPPEDPLVTEDEELLVAEPPLAEAPPPTVVDEDTLPDPAVTDDETPPPSDCSCSMTMHVEPSSSLTFFDAAWSGAIAAANSEITGTRNELEVISSSF
ncbi:hypothetical protein ACVIVC_002689 [Sinorhizobium meliloti]|nr:hypothetical protein SinmeB_4055 [Sinorhizobium meliloti BL225C]SDZ49843.1 hypothetical protein SAMN04244576_06197 [Sinorhizobium meliloti]